MKDLLETCQDEKKKFSHQRSSALSGQTGQDEIRMKFLLLSAVSHRLARRQVNVFAEFSKSVKRQVAENKEFQKNVQMLSDETTRLKESEAMQLAKGAAQSTSKIAKAVEGAVNATLETPVVKGTGKILYTAGKAVASTGAKVAEPILDTQAAKAVASGVSSVKKEIVDSSSSAYFAEYRPKEIRDQERMERAQKMQEEQVKRLSTAGTANPGNSIQSLAAMSGPVAADKDAGESVVLHRSSRLANAWSSFKDSSPVAQKLFAVKRGLEESDHPILERVREWMAKTKFEESEEARVIRAIREVDPTFRKDTFLKEMTLYTIPDILEVVLREDAKALKEWCSERVCCTLL